jgi:hypothetical protein
MTSSDPGASAAVPTVEREREAAPPTPHSRPAETVSEKYLRHIRNVVVAAFVIWIVGGVAGGIAWIAISAHDHSAAQQQACSNAGGIWVNGSCLGG